MEYVRPFDTLTLDDIPLVGGKNASLGEMIRTLTPLGVRVPDGFALTANAYRALLDGPGVRSRLREALAGIDPRDVDSLRAAGERARRAVREAPFPPALLHEVETAYAALSRRYGSESVDVAVRSSATAEDLPTASFAGQQETYLNVHGVANLVDACRRCFASLFTDRAISLSRRARLRPREGLSLDRRAEDGALGPRRLGRALHARHRERLRPGRADHRRSTGSARTSSRASPTPTSTWSSSRR